MKTKRSYSPRKLLLLKKFIENGKSFEFENRIVVVEFHEIDRFNPIIRFFFYKKDHILKIENVHLSISDFKRLLTK